MRLHEAPHRERVDLSAHQHIEAAPRRHPPFRRKARAEQDGIGRQHHVKIKRHVRPPGHAKIFDVRGFQQVEAQDHHRLPAMGSPDHSRCLMDNGGSGDHKRMTPEVTDDALIQPQLASGDLQRRPTRRLKDSPLERPEHIHIGRPNGDGHRDPQGDPHYRDDRANRPFRQMADT